MKVTNSDDRPARGDRDVTLRILKAFAKPPLRFALAGQYLRDDGGFIVVEPTAMRA
jgi:hypothetical protein